MVPTREYLVFVSCCFVLVLPLALAVLAVLASEKSATLVSTWFLSMSLTTSFITSTIRTL